MSYRYIEHLSGDALARYRAKIQLIGLDCLSYHYPGDSWIDNPKEWPNVQYPDGYTYLVKTSGVFTHEAMKNYRSLEAHNFFVSGWVQTVLDKNVGGNHVLFRADINPSWRVTEEPHHPWVAVTTDSVVVTAHCDCMAGI